MWRNRALGLPLEDRKHSPCEGTGGTDMDETRFWDLIETSRDTEDLDDQLGYLTEELQQLSTTELLSFDDHFTRASHALHTWTVFGAGQAILGFVSEDVFADFRSWIISRGQDTYSHALNDPDASLARLSTFSYEQIGAAESIAALTSDIYHEREGAHMVDAYPDRLSADYPDGPPQGPEPPQDQAGIAAAYPRLTQRYKDSGDRLPLLTDQRPVV